jgi:arylsulfatase A-like enzyme
MALLAHSALALILVVFYTTPAVVALTAKDFQGKNVVLFITDQERAVQNFPSDWEEKNMPGLKRLQANGVTFKRAYTNSVTCSSARANMMTGLLPAQHGVRYKLRYDMPADKYPQVELPTDVANLATIAKAAGYNVVYKGKIDVFKGPNSTIATPADMEKYGFKRWNPPDSGLGNGLGEFGGGTAPDAGNDLRYMSSRAANESEVADGLEGVLQYVTEVAPLQQPFFLVVSLINPHDLIFYPTNLFSSAGYNDSWLQGDIGIPPTAYEKLTPTKPAVQAQFNVISDQVLGPLNTTQLQLNYVNFYGNLLKEQDKFLVQLLDALQPMIDQTLVIKTSDHGEVGLSHGLTRQKCYNMYEEATNVPLIFSNPVMFPKPRSSEALVSHIDLAPTLAELLGQSKVAKFEGISYVPVITENAASIQSYVVFTMEDYQIGQSQPPYVTMPADMLCIRESEWKFCKYYDPSAEVTKVKSEFEMYDLKKDSEETTNLGSTYYTRTAAQEVRVRVLRD